MTEPYDAAQALERVPYLRLLPAADRERLAGQAEVRRTSRGTLVFLEGEEAAGIFLILAGRVRIVRSSEDGREQVLHEERAGSTLAEVPVFAGGGYVGSAVAVEDSVVLFVPRPALEAALARHPASATEVIRILAGRIRKLAEVVEDLSLRDVTSRTAGYLLREMQRESDAIVQLPPTREELAAHVGTVREQASRALSRMRAGGVIAIEGNRVNILDLDRLRGMARGRRDA